MVPDNIGEQFKRSASCNNFLKRFFALDNLSHLSSLLFIRLNRKPLSYFSSLKENGLPFFDINLSSNSKPEKKSFYQTPRLNSQGS